MKNHEAVKPVMPFPGQTVSFKNYNKKIKHPYVIFIDFESILSKIDTKTNISKPIQKDNISYTKKTHEYISFRFTNYVDSRVDNTFYYPKCYRSYSEEDLKKVPNKFFL